MRVRIVDGAEQVAAVAVGIVGEVLAATPTPVIALPTGRTAMPLYARIAEQRAAGGWDLSSARVFNLDELLLAPAAGGEPHPASFRAFMLEHAGERIGLSSARWEMPDPAADPSSECRRYDRALADAAPLDLAVLGIGVDGHVAYNLPGAPHSGTHVVAVPDAVADTLAIAETERPLRAITIGLGPLRGARRLLLMATGGSKARAVQALVQGREDAQWPASLLRRHPAFDVVLDHAAADLL